LKDSDLMAKQLPKVDDDEEENEDSDLNDLESGEE
jgi:hypothetical protein